MANSRKKGGLGAESYFQNIPSLEPSEDDSDSSAEATQASLDDETPSEGLLTATEAKVASTAPETAQEPSEGDTEAELSVLATEESSTEPTVIDSQSISVLETTLDSVPDVELEVVEQLPVEPASEQTESAEGAEAKRANTLEPVETESSSKPYRTRTNLIDDDDLSQESDEEDEEDEEDEPERVKIRRTYALYEETQIALEEMKLAARKKGIKTTLGDILEEAVLLLMEKKGFTSQ